MKSKKTTIFVILAVFFVVLDRFLKALCLKGYFDQPVKLVDDILSLHYVKNYYISFSIPLSGPILTAIIGLIILILLIVLIKSFLSPNLKSPISLPNRKAGNLQYSLIILIIGTVLNFSDRLKFGYIIDYFDLKWFTVFNVADCFICLGIGWLLCLSIKKNRSAVNTN
jgi:signal peptidase II